MTAGSHTPPNSASSCRTDIVCLLPLAAAIALAAGCATAPGDKDVDASSSIVSSNLPGNLVDIRDVDPKIEVDLRYATDDNITGRPVYPKDMPCLVHRGTAEKLRVASAYLREHGHRLKIWDAWRPPAAHEKLFAAVPDGNFVAHPEVSWSRHCYGAAVDVTLVDRRGRDLEMPSSFDDFGEHAGTVYTGGDQTIRARLRLLQTAMVQAGFTAFHHEWWHFNDLDAEDITLVHAADVGVELPE